MRSRRMRVGVGRRSPIDGSAAPRFSHASYVYARLAADLHTRRSPKSLNLSYLHAVQETT